MDEKKLTQLIQELGAEKISGSVNIWHQVEKRFPANRQHFRRLSWPMRAAASVTLVAFMVTVALALDGLLRFGQDEGLDAVQSAGDIVHLNRVYTDERGLVFTLDYAYADANRLTIGYTFQVEITAQRSHAAWVNGELHDASGAAFVGLYNNRSNSGGAGGGGSSGHNTTPQIFHMQDSVEQSFDATSIAGTPEQITLTYVANYHVESDIAGESYEGAFTIDFEIPFHPGYRITEPVTATTAAAALTLQELVVTPSMTRAVICLESETFTFADYARPVLSIQHADATIYTGIPRMQVPADAASPCRTFLLPQALNDYAGDWQIQIDALISMQPTADALLAQALADEGIVYAPSQVGDDRYVLRVPSDLSEDAREALNERVEAVDLDMRARLPGPWTFSVTPTA